MNAILYHLRIYPGPVYSAKYIEQDGRIVAHQHVYAPGVERYSDAAVIYPHFTQKVAA